MPCQTSDICMAFLQRHLYGFSPVWTLICLFTLRDSWNALPHMWHLNGFSPLWILLCETRFPASVNRLLQTLHSNGFSPEWIRLWTLKAALLWQYFPHSVHLYLAVCIYMCLINSRFVLYCLSHTVHKYGLDLSSCGCSVISLLSSSGFTSINLPVYTQNISFKDSNDSDRKWENADGVGKNRDSRRISGYRIDDCWSASNNCHRPPWSLSHRLPCISESCLSQPAWTTVTKRTEQNLIVCNNSEVEVANNRRLHSSYCTIEANYWQIRSITAIVRLLVKLAKNQHHNFNINSSDLTHLKQQTSRLTSNTYHRHGRKLLAKWLQVCVKPERLHFEHL